MADRTFIPQPIFDYLSAVSVREPAALGRLREETLSQPRAGMQIAPDQGQFMALLVQLIGARNAIEVGVFTGYSSLAVALALPADGRLIACDISDEYTSIARRYWREAGVDHKIDLHLRPALETLRELLSTPGRGHFDFAFIDADKINYGAYYELVLELLRPGGLILVDNVLWSGKVADPSENDADTVALRAFNQKLLGDSRVTLSMLSMGDGVTLALKR